METAGKGRKTTGGGGRTTGETGGTREVRRGMEAAIGGSKVTTIKELEEEEEEEAVQTVCWRPVLTPAQAPAPRYSELV